MKKQVSLAAIAIAICCACQAQQTKDYPQPEAMRPGMSEYWTPQPKVVTPGSITANTAPSDAIVLFDGKDLSAWMSPDGKSAEWTVKGGVMTVDKSKGDIITRQKFGSFQLHLEWCVPKEITGKRQQRRVPAGYVRSADTGLLRQRDIRQRYDWQHLQTNATIGQCDAQAGRVECL